MNKLLKQAIDITAELDERKVLYSKLNEVILELKDSGFKSEVVDGILYELKDAFADSNTGWTAAAVQRYALKKKKAK